MNVKGGGGGGRTKDYLRQKRLHRERKILTKLDAERNDTTRQRVTIRRIGFTGHLYTSSPFTDNENTAIFLANDNITPHGLTPVAINAP